MSTLIIIRGNSGSGKSTVAKLVRDGLAGKVAFVEQDYIRRVILREKERGSIDNIVLIKQTVQFALKQNYIVILEGILNMSRYGDMLKEVRCFADKNYSYYIDVSLEETLARHKTKSNAHEFGEEQIREWYKEKDLGGFKEEVTIKETSSIKDSVKIITNNVG